MNQNENNEERKNSFEMNKRNKEGQKRNWKKNQRKKYT